MIHLTDFLHAPTTSTKITGNGHPYLTADVKLVRNRDSLKAKANKTGPKYTKLAYQHMKSKVEYKIRELKVNYYADKITESKGSLKGTWKVLKQLTSNANKSISIRKLTIDGDGNFRKTRNFQQIESMLFIH